MAGARLSDLTTALESARRRGLLGSPAGGHIAHAEALAGLITRGGSKPPRTLLDLGSGGGVPGLVLAVIWPACEVTLLDAHTRSTRFLAAAVTRLGLETVQVVTGRAEQVARLPDHRGRYELVTARGFGPPAAAAECGAGFLVAGGLLAVSEPPGVAAQPPDRWPVEPLTRLGLRLEAYHTHPIVAALLRSSDVPPDAVPRAIGRPGKRPLW